MNRKLNLHSERTDGPQMIISMPYSTFREFLLFSLETSLVKNRKLCERWNAFLQDAATQPNIEQILRAITVACLEVSDSLYDESFAQYALEEGDFESDEPKRLRFVARTPEREEEDELLSKAADYARLPTFRRNVNLVDVMFDVIGITIVGVGCSIVERAVDLWGNGTDPSAISFSRLLADLALHLPPLLFAYARSIHSLPKLRGIEHCVLIKAVSVSEIGQPFVAEDLLPLFSSSKCNIPARRWWRCAQRGGFLGPCGVYENDSETGGGTPALNDLANALKGLADKRFLKPANSNEDKPGYIIPFPRKRGLFGGAYE